MLLYCKDRGELVCSQADGKTFRIHHEQTKEFDKEQMTPLIQSWIDKKWIIVLKDIETKQSNKTAEKAKKED